MAELASGAVVRFYLIGISAEIKAGAVGALLEIQLKEEVRCKPPVVL